MIFASEVNDLLLFLKLFTRKEILFARQSPWVRGG
jgi:hypothetical protein